MSQTQIKKDFDSLEFKQQVQEEIQTQIKNLNYQEQIQYFHLKAESGLLGDWWKSVKNQSITQSKQFT